MHPNIYVAWVTPTSQFACCCRLWKIMNYEVKMTSNVITFIWNFVKRCQQVQNWNGGGGTNKQTHMHRQHGELMNLPSSLRKFSKLKQRYKLHSYNHWPTGNFQNKSCLLAYFPYFGKKMKGSLWNRLAVCVCLCIPPTPDTTLSLYSMAR
jgi:hypothetical protein